MKRSLVFIIVFAAVILALLLNGCMADEVGTYEYTDGSAAVDGTVMHDGTSTSAAPLKISILTQDTYDPNWPQSKGLPIVKELQKRTNVEIEFQCASVSQIANTVQTRLAAGTDLPDIVNVGFMSVTSLYNLGKQGIIVELTDLLPRFAPNMTKTYNELPEFKNCIVAPDGRIYWFCYVQYIEPEHYTGIWLRRDFLNNVGITKLPETTDELYAAIKAMHDGDANRNGKTDEVYLPYQWWQFEWGLPQPFGVKNNTWNVDENGKVYFGRLTEGYRDFLMFANRLYREQLTDPDVVTIPWDKYYAKMTSNIIAGSVNCPRAMAWNKHNSNSGKSDPVFLAPLKGPSGQKVSVKSNSGGGAYAITKDCKNVKKVLKFLDYLYSPEGEMLCKYGIEGVHYTRDAKGGIVRTQAYREGVKDPNYYWSQGFGFGTSLPMKNLQDTEEFLFINNEEYKTWNIDPNQLRDVMKMYKKDALPDYPYIIATEGENRQMDALGTDWVKYIDEMVIKFFMGKETFDKWDEFVKKANELGAAKARDIEQAKYNRWKVMKR